MSEDECAVSQSRGDEPPLTGIEGKRRRDGVPVRVWLIQVALYGAYVVYCM